MVIYRKRSRKQNKKKNRTKGLSSCSGDRENEKLKPRAEKEEASEWTSRKEQSD